MEYNEDNNLTDSQNDLKWSIYSGVEWEFDSDIVVVLKSLLADIHY